MYRLTGSATNKPSSQSNDVTYTMTFSFETGVFNCTSLNNLSSNEVTELSDYLLKFFKNYIDSLNGDETLEIVNVWCGSLIVEFRVLNSTENDLSQKFSALANKTMEWRGETLAYQKVTAAFSLRNLPPQIQSSFNPSATDVICIIIAMICGIVFV